MDSAPKTVLITGASRGIGRAAALLCGARGWSVAVNWFSDGAMAEQTVQDVRAAGGRALSIRADIADEAQVEALFDETEAALCRIDAVIVNAGITAPALPLAEMSLARMQQVVNVNLIGALLCARAAARRLPRAMGEPSASLVFLSSAAARLGSPHEYVDYAATKGAIDTLTIGLSKELARANIRVNAVRPGVIDTDIHASGGDPGRAARLAPLVPLGRPGTAAEVAEALVWLCSDAAAYTSGAIIDVAGGR